VGVAVGVVDAALVGVGVALPVGVGVSVGVAFAFDFGVGVAFVVTEGSGVADGEAGVSVGVINMTRIALSSGTGERIFLLERTMPMTTMTRMTTPTMIVSAAIVFLRSSIRRKYTTRKQSDGVPYLISSFFHAAKVQVG
jgi:hypothetical protein